MLIWQVFRTAPDALDEFWNWFYAPYKQKVVCSLMTRIFSAHLGSLRMASVPWLKESGPQEIYLLTGVTAVMEISLFLVLPLCDISF